MKSGSLIAMIQNGLRIMNFFHLQTLVTVTAGFLPALLSLLKLLCFALDSTILGNKLFARPRLKIVIVALPTIWRLPAYNYVKPYTVPNKGRVQQA